MPSALSRWGGGAETKGAARSQAAQAGPLPVPGWTGSQARWRRQSSAAHHPTHCCWPAVTVRRRTSQSEEHNTKARHRRGRKGGTADTMPHAHTAHTTRPPRQRQSPAWRHITLSPRPLDPTTPALLQRCDKQPPPLHHPHPPEHAGCPGTQRQQRRRHPHTGSGGGRLAVPSCKGRRSAPRRRRAIIMQVPTGKSLIHTVCAES